MFVRPAIHMLDALKLLHHTKHFMCAFEGLKGVKSVDT